MTPEQGGVEVTPEYRAVERWARQARDAVVARDRQIRRMRDTGATLRQIAEAAHMSPEAVRKILAKR
ncbi:MAG: hypothetical protein LC798_02970 [Chloroflexi bacterium]|nr:hypothetical protein [Chloroflexota bacterium]